MAEEANVQVEDKVSIPVSQAKTGKILVAGFIVLLIIANGTVTYIIHDLIDRLAVCHEQNAKLKEKLAALESASLADLQPTTWAQARKELGEGAYLVSAEIPPFTEVGLTYRAVVLQEYYAPGEVAMAQTFRAPIMVLTDGMPLVQGASSKGQRCWPKQNYCLSGFLPPQG